MIFIIYFLLFIIYQDLKKTKTEVLNYILE